MKANVLMLCSALLGALLTYVVMNEQNDAVDDAQQAPLYWVAPMDDSYRRDGPGKSPMGMDLVPVYDTVSPSDKPATGVVRIPANVQQNMGVKTEILSVGPLASQVRGYGTVSLDESAIVHVHPRVEGWIETLFVKAEGDRVEKGQPLYTLYSPQLVSAQEEYIISLKRGDERLAKSARERLEALNLSDEIIDSLNRTRVVSQTVTFYAPQSGFLETLNVREGFFIKPGNTLMSIGRLDSVWIDIHILARHMSRIQLGDDVLVTSDVIPQTVWTGRVDYIYPMLDKQQRTSTLRVVLDNKDTLLRPNMYVMTAINVTNNKPVLRVPRQSVIQVAGQSRLVLGLGNGEFKSVNIETGDNDDRYVEVVDGVLPGDTIVTSSHFLIDSESAKSSDFMRMSEPDNQATVSGVITGKSDINENGSGTLSTLTIARDAIPKWGRDADEMTFEVSPHIDVASFGVGDAVTFTFVAGDFSIIDINHASSKSIQHHEDMGHEHMSNEAMGNKKTKHKDMHHEGMNHD
ncbi:efflux RND transporter periplasmic adaptor subunit [Alteromonas sp. A079]|uniref:efflux RND transporter periplasmic adaptor subunit n=1 Tax=Alteromonas sp. A079 TaxID=3410268 RepID=UPI003BA1F885